MRGIIRIIIALFGNVGQTCWQYKSEIILLNGEGIRLFEVE